MRDDLKKLKKIKQAFAVRRLPKEPIKSCGGFVALFSVIIISFILVLIATTLSFTGFFARFDIFDSESKKKSEYLASACIEHARLIIAQDTSFIGVKEGDLIIDGPDNECHYYLDTANSIITARSIVNSNAHTYYWSKVIIDEPKIPLTEFKECVTYKPLDPTNCPSP